jgi:hypothetical protein
MPKKRPPNAEATECRSGEEAVENGRKGGIASGVARREKKTVQKILREFLDTAVEDNPKALALAKKLGVQGDQSIKELFTVACIMNTAKMGGLEDLEKLSAMLGEQDQSEGGANNMVALADLINHPMPDRNIADFETSEVDDE